MMLELAADVYLQIYTTNYYFYHRATFARHWLAGWASLVCSA
jgi:hypothetical protein